MRNRRNHMIFNSLIVLLAAGSLAMAGDTLERTFSFGGGVLEIDTDKGHINIDTSGSGEVRVRIEEVRDQLVQELERKAVTDYLEALQAELVIERP